MNAVERFLPIDFGLLINAFLVLCIVVACWNWVGAEREIGKAEQEIAHHMSLASINGHVAANCVMQWRDHADSAAATSAALRRLDGGQWGTR